eukprot:15113139-Alexandrium_andersonii.AAC.1
MAQSASAAPAQEGRTSATCALRAPWRAAARWMRTWPLKSVISERGRACSTQTPRPCATRPRP